MSFISEAWRAAKDPILASLWIIAAIFGLSCIVLAWGLFPLAQFPLVHNVLGTVGSATLAGGVFAALLKSWQFSGVFAKAISDVIYSERFIGSRSDLQGIWDRLTAHLYQQKFPKISTKINDIIRSDCFPGERDYYFENRQSHYIIAWHNKERGEISVSENRQATIVPHDVGQGCLLHSRHRSTVRESLTIESYTIDGLKVDKNNFPGFVETKNEFEKETGYYVTNSKIPLKGKEEFKINRKEKKIVSILEKPYMQVIQRTYVANQSITVIVKAQDLAVVFLGSAGNEWFGHEDVAGENDGFIQTQKRLLLPGQGFTLFFRRKVVTEEA